MKKLYQQSVLQYINPIRAAAELVSAVKGKALRATQGRPLRDMRNQIITFGTVP
ncbi:MAG: hypothetical protein AB1744_05665 [Candidatus Zixiibacteriota bacterium]